MFRFVFVFRQTSQCRLRSGRPSPTSLHGRAGNKGRLRCEEEHFVIRRGEGYTAHADRLKAIKLLPLLTEGAVERVMAEVKTMRPKPEPGFVNEGALIVQTCRGNLLRGHPWGKKKKALAWSFTIDVSDDSGTKDLVVYKGDWREVCAAVSHI